MAAAHTRRIVIGLLGIAAIGIGGSAWVVEGIATPAQAGAPITKRGPYTTPPPADAEYVASGVFDNRSWRDSYDRPETASAPVYGASPARVASKRDRSLDEMSLASADIDLPAEPKEAVRTADAPRAADPSGDMTADQPPAGDPR